MKEKRVIKKIGLLGILIFIFIVLIVQSKEKTRIKSEDEVKTVSLLISTNGDNLRKEYIQEETQRFQNANRNYRVEVTFVESDTLAFLKLLYSNGKVSYDIVGLGGESVVSAVEQGLVYPLDTFVLRDYGFQWLNNLPESHMENTAYGGKLYALPFIKSHLYYYKKEMMERPGGEQGRDAEITIWEALSQSSENKKMGIPVNVLIKDTLLSREPGIWELDNSQIPYQVDTIFAENLLRELKSQKDQSLILYQSYEKEISDFLAGKTESIILEDSYESKILNENEHHLEKYQIYMTDSVPWITQGYNLMLVNKGLREDYENAWKVMKYMRDSWETLKQADLEMQIAEYGVEKFVPDEKIYYKRISSRYNTKVQLIVDRMISELLHGNQETDSMLEKLQLQMEKIQSLKWQE